MAPVSLSPESLALDATQKKTAEVLVPCLVGWSIQFFLSAIVADRSIRILRRRNAAKFNIAWMARPLFIVASCCNLIVGFICVWNIGLYTISQDRSVAYITSYKLPDVLGLAFGLPCALCTQVFMAIRIWKLTSKNLPIIAIITLCLLAATTGGLWATVIVGLLQHGSLDDNQRIFLPTVIWLVGNVVTDIIITIVFITYLARLRRGTTKSSTGSFAASLIRLAFETCAIPLFVTLFSAMMRAISTISSSLSHVATASILCIPSLYIFSFIYCVEGTAQRKHLLDRERRSIEAGADMGPKNTASSQSRTSERRKAVKMALNLDRPVSGAESESKSPVSWEPPLAWASTIEQVPESLPRPSSSQTRSMLEDEKDRLQPSVRRTSLTGFRIEAEDMHRSSDSPVAVMPRLYHQDA